jgi:nucleotide-binding universal stress UspA family protein
MLPFRNILCPTDFSPSSRLALAKAGDLAAHFKAKLYVLHVVAAIGNELGAEAVTLSDYQDAALVEAQNQIVEEIECVVPQGVDSQVSARLGGDEAEEIVSTAREAGVDLIVIATHGVTGWRHFVFGSVTEKVLRSAPCPVLVIHGER